jgi:hypothetical protein
MHGLVVATLCLSLGVHWALLQSLAWTGMLLSWSQEVSLVEAVKNTFDGEHPCPLCKAVESGQKQTPKSVPLQRIKFDAVLAAAIRLVPPPAVPLIHAEWRAMSAEGHFETRLRPPRGGEAPLV